MKIKNMNEFSFNANLTINITFVRIAIRENANIKAKKTSLKDRKS